MVHLGLALCTLVISHFDLQPLAVDLDLRGLTRLRLCRLALGFSWLFFFQDILLPQFQASVALDERLGTLSYSLVSENQAQVVHCTLNVFGNFCVDEDIEYLV